MRAPRLLLLAVIVSASATLAAQGGELKLNIVDPPGIGFNDPTPVAPVGGNAGTTLGQQRRIVFQTAAGLWTAALHPNVDVIVQASFAPLPCGATSGVLGAAGTITVFANFSNAEWPNTWYHSALANHLAGFDLTPGPPDPGLLQPPFNDDIVAYFNGDIGVNPECLTGFTWYNGLDNNAPGDAFDLLNVVLHEFSHGLGFANFVDDATGNNLLGLSDVYSAYSRDNSSGLYWNQMDKHQRAASAVDTGKLVWRGPTVFGAAPGFLIGKPVVRVNVPSGIGDLTAQAASFGALPPAPPGVSGDVVLYDDGTGPDPNDACDAFDPGVAGKIALINRGTCTFAFKTAVAQLSGAIGVIIVNNQPAGLPPMGGTDLAPGLPSITALGISRDDGNLLKGELPGVNASLVADQALGLSGADAGGFPLLYAPNPVEPGSSVSHWDTTLTPNALMEPFISSDLKGATTLDLTPDQMFDVGWKDGPHCPVGSDDRATVMFGSCSTGVSNTKGPFGFSLGLGGRPNGNAYGVDVNGGCYIQDMINACRLQGSRARVNSCVTHTTDYLERIGVITSLEGRAIRACASR
jgi:hypothetical protein